MLALAVSFTQKTSLIGGWLCTFIAWVCASAMASGIGWIELSKHPKTYAAICSVALGIAGIGFGLWISPSSAPHVSVELTMDSLTQNLMEFHLRVENIGDVKIENLRYHYSTDGDQNAAWFAFPSQFKFRELPPKGRLAINGKLACESCSGPIVYLIYDVKSSVGTKTFRTACKFATPAESQLHTALDPVEFKESEGDNSEKQFKDHIFKALAGADGYYMGTLPESGPDGKPNHVVMRNSFREFEFDPEKRLIAFSSRSGGTTKVLTQPLNGPFSPNTYHVVMVRWVASGLIYLNVDDYPEISK